MGRCQGSASRSAAGSSQQASGKGQVSGSAARSNQHAGGRAQASRRQEGRVRRRWQEQVSMAVVGSVQRVGSKIRSTGPRLKISKLAAARPDKRIGGRVSRPARPGGTVRAAERRQG